MNKKQTKFKGVPRVDFATLKREFFISDYSAVEPFFLDKIGKFNKWHAENTTGWGKEKDDWRMGMVERALDQIQEFEAKENAKALIMIMGGLRNKIANEDKARAMTIDELEKLWNIFMTMNGRVTRITSQTTKEAPVQPVDFSEEAQNRLKKYTDEPNLLSAPKAPPHNL